MRRVKDTEKIIEWVQDKLKRVTNPSVEHVIEIYLLEAIAMTLALQYELTNEFYTDYLKCNADKPWMRMEWKKEE